jgi:hypothetical protein
MTLPNGNSISSIGTGLLYGVSPYPIVAHIFADTDLYKSLLSLSDLCKQGCKITLTNEALQISMQNRPILSFSKDSNTSLWSIPLNPSSIISSTFTPSVSNVVHHQINADFVAFWHAALGSPPIATLLMALRRNYLHSLPRLTAKMVYSNPPQSIATAKGHLDLHRKGFQSTKVTTISAKPSTNPLSSQSNSIITPSLHPSFPKSPISLSDSSLPDPSPPDNLMYSRTCTLENALHADAAGRFPHISSRGNQYILITVYHGYIHGEIMTSRTSASYVTAYTSSVDFFRSKGHIVSHIKLDNEISGALQTYFGTSKLIVERVPPNNHRTNRAERAIRSFKNHFISILSGLHPSFPMTQWDLLVPQALLTLNLLRAYKLDPKISAYHGIYGASYDFLAHPIAPCGTSVLIHETPANRKSWDSHGVSGFYLGPALDFYRSFKVYVISTNSVRVSDSLHWFPTTVKLPGSSSIEVLHSSLSALTLALETIANSSTLSQAQKESFQHLSDSTIQSFKDSITLFDSPTHPTGFPTLPNVADLPRVVTQHFITPPTLMDSPLVPIPPPSSPISIPTVSEPPIIVPRVIDTVPTQSFTLVSPPTLFPPPQPPIHRSGTLPRRSPPRRPPTISAPFVIPDISPSRPPSTRTRSVPSRFCSSVFKSDSQYPSRRLNSAARTISGTTVDASGTPLTYKSAITGPDSALWRQAECEEFIRLLKSGTISFIHHHSKPKDRLASYYNPQVRFKYKNGVADYRVRGTYGGDRTDYTGEVTAFTADITTFKVLLNVGISTGQQFMTLDIKDFYLGTDLIRKEYMKIQRRQVPQAIIDQYNLEHLFFNDSIMVEISKGIYGLPQAGKLAQDRLILHLAKHGYHPTTSNPCLFRHSSGHLSFTLVVDDFGVIFRDRASAEHLISALSELYVLTTDWSGSKYIGIDIDYNLSTKTVNLSMPGYVEKALQRFGVIRNSHATHSPILFTPHQYGRVAQELPPEDTSPSLTQPEKSLIQQIIGVFLFYSRSVDSTMLTALNKLALTQAHGTQTVLDAADRFLQYAASYPDAVLTFHASSLHLAAHSDASYLSESNARSRAAAVLYFTSPGDPTLQPINGFLEVLSCVIPCVVASAFEAEYATLFLTGQLCSYISNICSDLGHPQEAIPIVCDNKAAVGVANKTTKQKNSKSIDMRFHWIRDLTAQGKFKILWHPGSINLADYYTKAHPASLITDMRKYHVASLSSPSIKQYFKPEVRGCVSRMRYSPPPRQLLGP